MSPKLWQNAFYVYYAPDRDLFDDALQALRRQDDDVGRRAVLAQARENDRALYRRTWRHPPTRAVLDSVPNLMIWDDHEIRDDWGGRNGDTDPSRSQYTLGCMARGVYRATQRQLWDDVETADPSVLAPSPAGYEHHLHAWGDLGVFFIDPRTARSFAPMAGRPDAGPLLDELEKALYGGALSAVRALVLVSPVPVAFLSSATANQLGHHATNLFNDLRDHWSYYDDRVDHRPELRRLLDLLRTWQAQAGHAVVIVSGDVHVGAMTTIHHAGGSTLEQLITSPMNTLVA